MDQKSLILSILAISLTILIFSSETQACSCYPSHPQTSYCNSEYGNKKITVVINWCNDSLTFIKSFTVIVARILRKSNRRINNQHIYKIDIVKTYKTSEKAQQYLRQSRLITAPSDGLCGINFSKSANPFMFVPNLTCLSLEIGQLYAIAGNSQKVGLCQYIKEYSKMSQVEKRGIAGAYKKGCGCEVSLYIIHTLGNCL